MISSNSNKETSFFLSLLSKKLVSLPKILIFEIKKEYERTRTE